MATLTTTLTLKSSTLTTDLLDMTDSETLTVGAPAIMPSRVALEATGGSATVIKPAGSAGNHYLYVKHTGFVADGTTPATGAVVLTLASASLSVIQPNEWCFFNVINSGIISAISSSSDLILLEYGYWTKA
tara:strand:- start:5363 stop:5755 length:393 start_codon:yes stop_codon:yes gene_type:complete